MPLIEQPPAYEAKAPSAGRPLPGAQEAGSVRPAARDVALDVVKGLSVIIMVLYHSAEYFPDCPFNFKYLAFVSGAFIFLAGFVVTSIYFQKYGAKQDWRGIFRRLAVRGLKLILIAAVSNVLIWSLLAKKEAHLGTLFYNLFTGADYRAASFVLLVVIGYSLVATGILVAAGRGRPVVLVVAMVVSVVYSFVSNHFQWPHDYYFRLLAIGQLGAALGLCKRATILKISGKLESIMVLYFIEVLLLAALPPNYALYVINLLCTLLVAYSLALKWDENSVVCRKLALLGRYSLLSYLAQIVILQFLRREIGQRATDEWVVGIFVFTCVATLGCVELTQMLRKKSKVVDQTYQAVFC